SSPKNASPGRSRSTSSRSARSTARSASVTGVASGFVSTRRSSARKRGRAVESARSARRTAKARSASTRRPYSAELEARRRLREGRGVVLLEARQCRERNEVARPGGVEDELLEGEHLAVLPGRAVGEPDGLARRLGDD